MKFRCTNSKTLSHIKYYQNKGIKVCERWRKSFKDFLEDMGPMPGLGYTIDRIDSTKDYCPENCRWATHTEQNRNLSNTKFYNYNNKLRPLSEISELSNIPYSTLWSRLNTWNWKPEKAFNL